MYDLLHFGTCALLVHSGTVKMPSIGPLTETSSLLPPPTPPPSSLPTPPPSLPTSPPTHPPSSVRQSAHCSTHVISRVWPSCLRTGTSTLLTSRGTLLLRLRFRHRLRLRLHLFSHPNTYGQRRVGYRHTIPRSMCCQIERKEPMITLL